MSIQYETIMTFESKSSKTGKCYTVKKRADTGALSCDCPQWIFNRNGDRTCYHTERVKVLRIQEAVSAVASTPLSRTPFVPNIPLQVNASVRSQDIDSGPITEQPRKLRMKEGDVS